MIPPLRPLFSTGSQRYAVCREWDEGELGVETGGGENTGVTHRRIGHEHSEETEHSVLRAAATSPYCLRINALEIAHERAGNQSNQRS